MTSPDLAALVLRAQVGDRAALCRLLAALQDSLEAYLRTLVGDAAPDVLQETLIRVATKLKHLRAPGAVRAWAFRIAGREAFKRLRGQQRRAEVAIDAQTPVGVVPLTQTELAAEVYLLDKVLQQLPPASRAVVWLHYIGQMSIGDVAATLEIKVGTAKSRLAYGIAKLRAIVGAR